MNVPLMLSTLLALGGMLALCLGLERHFKQFCTRKPPNRILQGIRIAGWLALAGSLWTSAGAWGWAMGTVGWVGLISIAGITLVFVAPYLAKRNADSPSRPRSRSLR